MDTLRRVLALVLALAGCAAGLSSCAVGTANSPPPASMPAARAGLAPEYRIFYDTLQEYGDWLLIEPYGYLFRPRASFHDWRPYQSGFWAPTDAYGWVWISNEPFGWATYHYGRWFYDDFQGWVWKPGAEWAPAWVSWRANDQYVGWSPFLAQGSESPIPGGAYLFASVDALGSADLATQIKTAGQLGAAVADTKPVNDAVELDGVRVPSGPPVTLIERMQGQKLLRARIDDLLPRAQGEERTDNPPPAPPTLEELRRAGEQASREARAISARGGRPTGILPIVRPLVSRGLARPAPAVRDSAARRPGD